MTDFRKGADKIRFRRGDEQDVHLLDLAEPAFITDKKKILVGTGTENLELAQQKHIQLGLGIIPSMIYREEGMDDRAFLQRAIDFCEANNVKLTLENGRVYTLSGALYYTSIVLDGNNATLRQRTVNEPIMMSRCLLDATKPVGGNSRISNLKFEGNYANTQNHGLYAVSYSSRYENLEFTNIGGTGLFISNANQQGVNLVTGTFEGDSLQGLRFTNVRNHCIYIGDAQGSGRLTHGRIRDVFIRTAGNTGIYMPSCIGWAISGVRIAQYDETYPNVGLRIVNGIHSTLSDIQIMGYRQTAIILESLQAPTALSNITIDSSRGPNEHGIFKISRATWAANLVDTSLSISNLAVYHNSSRICDLFDYDNPVNVSVAGFYIGGSRASNVAVLYSEQSQPETHTNYIANASIAGRLADTPEKHFLTYQGSQLKQTVFAHFTGATGSIARRLPMPVVPPGGKILCDVTVRSVRTGSKTPACSWHGQVYVERRSASVEAANGIMSVQADILPPIGFAGVIQVVPFSGDYLNVTFRTDGSDIEGIIVVDYTVCPA